MKTIIIYLLIFTPILSFGQLIDELPQDESGKLNYSEIVQVDNVSKDELYQRSKQFFIDELESDKDIIQLDDQESGTVVAKGFYDVYVGLTKYQMWFTVKIQSKEGRYKYDIYNIYFRTYPDDSGKTITLDDWYIFDRQRFYKKNGKPQKRLEKYKNAMTEQLTSLIKLIKVSMDNSGTSDSNDEGW